MANVPLSYSSLLTQADTNWNRYKAEADARDAEMYGPGGLMRTVMRPIEHRLPPQWDAFFQAFQNNGVKNFTNIDRQAGRLNATPVLGATNQFGSVTERDPEGYPASMAPLVGKQAPKKAKR
jgi:hypothetical protein